MKSQSRFILVVLVILVALSLTLMGTTATFAGEKAYRGVLDEGYLIAYGSSSYAPLHFSGRIWEGYGKIEGIGEDTTVRVSACWDWYSDMGNGGYPIPKQYSSTYHPAALMVTTLVGHTDTKAVTDHTGAFDCEATVTIISKKGDVLVGTIGGGSVYELTVFGWHDSINEWVINFKITSGTGRFLDASGTGVYRMIWQSGDGSETEYPFIVYDVEDGGLVDPRRFLEQEIFLNLD